MVNASPTGAQEMIKMGLRACSPEHLLERKKCKL